MSDDKFRVGTVAEVPRDYGRMLTPRIRINGDLFDATKLSSRTKRLIEDIHYDLRGAETSSSNEYSDLRAKRALHSMKELQEFNEYIYDCLKVDWYSRIRALDSSIIVEEREPSDDDSYRDLEDQE